MILVGDGAFQMTGWELGNCRRYGLDPIVVLFNNCSWEMLRVFQPELKFNDLSDWNFAAIAPSLGGHGERVTTREQLRDALEAAVARRGQFSHRRGDAEARRDLGHAAALRHRIQGRARADGEKRYGRPIAGGGRKKGNAGASATGGSRRKLSH